MNLFVTYGTNGDDVQAVAFVVAILVVIMFGWFLFANQTDEVRRWRKFFTKDLLTDVGAGALFVRLDERRICFVGMSALALCGAESTFRRFCISVMDSHATSFALVTISTCIARVWLKLVNRLRCSDVWAFFIGANFCFHESSSRVISNMLPRKAAKVK